MTLELTEEEVKAVRNALFYIVDKSDKAEELRHLAYHMAYVEPGSKWALEYGKLFQELLPYRQVLDRLNKEVN